MSNPPEKKHPWAKFKATPSAPRLPTERAVLRTFAPKEKTGGAASLVPGPKSVEPALPPVPVPTGVPSARATEPVPTKPAVKPVAKTEVKRPAARAEVRPAPAPLKAKEPPAKAEAAAPKPAVSAGLANVLSDLERADLDPAVVKRVGRERDTSPRQRRWVWYGLKESVRNYRRTWAQLGAWWRVWRTGSSARVLLAFVAIYGLLAVMRKPSDVAAERSRIGEEIAFLQGFLKSYCAAGGPVLTVKPHGGAELYPRGIVLKGEVLNAFVRAPVGGVFAVHVTAPEWNPLEAFFGFPPVYAGGTYYHLERKINFPLYRCSFLIRKASEREGAILLTLVERAH